MWIIPLQGDVSIFQFIATSLQPAKCPTPLADCTTFPEHGDGPESAEHVTSWGFLNETA
jgi:hypothetical protein